jgi:hypothetical protein
MSDRARRGEAVGEKIRPVVVKDVTIESFSPPYFELGKCPPASLTRCGCDFTPALPHNSRQRPAAVVGGGGLYVRSLVRDLAERAGGLMLSAGDCCPFLGAPMPTPG